MNEFLPIENPNASFYFENAFKKVRILLFKRNLFRLFRMFTKLKRQRNKCHWGWHNVSRKIVSNAFQCQNWINARHFYEMQQLICFESSLSIFFICKSWVGNLRQTFIENSRKLATPIWRIFGVIVTNSTVDIVECIFSSSTPQHWIHYSCTSLFTTKFG